ncbi:tRNA (adenosine(37)-N6)-threonylcarbamoyltransferase complex dimerization subunit type 1 TsaB [Bombiscardovia apis]|uniref:tRNA (Adenosine(37)-N6)-threonylcarbamoyltransferase complex dimerization subunit type 1 TsaB n=1 Tax=Bombiscardovia apis TaxID=2932182 RepID=A0ABM8BCJ0_9BIFI|nr:tRNA (adenosine(37)-N6)-threonylcarbamoyltransferase complex dimerization subunit type 1 TsaB [Bombiscardovia apis]BDR54616.1 tRNA (adenosine(37)-N6)-threonylcarbamoyltransferase complex dimerization subunit type 1 TsaB [Bombiscardovia apis]
MNTHSEHQAGGSQQGRTLLIDTSYGLTVALDHAPVITEQDSRQHVELLQPSIQRLLTEAAIEASSISTVIVGVGPAPFTGLRTGIVAAKALAFATGAQLIGQDILSAQAAWSYKCFEEAAVQERASTKTAQRLTLAVNDARRRQLYFQLFEEGGQEETKAGARPLTEMDIDYPDHIAERINQACSQWQEQHLGLDYQLVVTGRGVEKYAESWKQLDCPALIQEDSLLDHGEQGVQCFIDCARSNRDGRSVEPLYLRRPDVSVPNPRKHVVSA